MDIEYTIEDVEGDIISFQTYAGNDTVKVSIPINIDTMGGNTACVVLDKQDIARLVEKLELPEVYYE